MQNNMLGRRVDRMEFRDSMRVQIQDPFLRIFLRFRDYRVLGLGLSSFEGIRYLNLSVQALGFRVRNCK